MRGIETERENCGVFVRPLQGRGGGDGLVWFGMVSWGSSPGVALGAAPQAIT